jgi:hypothetical protein
VFFPRTTPLSVAPAHVRGLRLSLNTPVVATEDLPIGPARAAILVHEEPGRGETVTIGVRSLRADRVALYGIDPEVGDGASLDVALDAALSFAESMGFLFDEDEVGSGGAAERRRSHGLWSELLGEGAPAAAVRSAAREREDPEELLLEELAEDATEVVAPDAESFTFEDEEGSAADGSLEPEPPEPEPLDRSDAEVVAQVARAAAGGERRQAPLALTKFRGGPPARGARAPKAPAPAAGPGATAAEARPRRAKPLAKLRLVRRIRDGVRRRNPLLRLFGAF